jgi:aldose 1-epimerase
MSTVSVNSEPFGQYEHQHIELYTISNNAGVTVKLFNYGATLYSLSAPDRDGNIKDLTLGYGTLSEYTTQPNYYGSTVGRYANRIDSGKFSIDGREYQLSINEGQNHLHGGKEGFSTRVWRAEASQQKESAAVKFSLTSGDKDQGYPGNLEVELVVSLTADNRLCFNYKATTDIPTIVNLTNHTFWNLSGNPEKDVLEHMLQINGGKYTPVNEDLIPTGEVAKLPEALDFTGAKEIGSDITDIPGGYDHNYVLAETDSSENKLAAVLHHPPTGRTMEVYTTEPGLQFYSGNFLDGSDKGRGGIKYDKYAGLCLETQHWPDSPNHENFPSTFLRPGQLYTHRTVHKFYTK